MAAGGDGQASRLQRGLVINMDGLRGYADSESSSEGAFDVSARAVIAAPEVDIGPLSADEGADPGVATTRTPAGVVEAADFDARVFDEQERSFGNRGVFQDPEEGFRRHASVPVAAAGAAGRAVARPLVRKRPRAGAELDVPKELVRKENIDSEEGEVAAARRRGKKRNQRPEPVLVPSSELLVRNHVDYLGRSWVQPPPAARTFEDLEEYTPYIPKHCVHHCSGAHAKGVSAVRFFPRYGHLLLSAGLDGVAKVWDVEKHHKCVRSYTGHSKGIRDICFANDGRSFLTASYDRSFKLWDTESGRVLGSFVGNRAIPYCIRFNPDEDKQNEFLVGCSDKKIVQMDVRDANKIVQEYDQHMGGVNSITFVDENRRFVSSADDKVLRVWEYGIPVVIKYISDPLMHSMPVVAAHPNRKWIACQSMDNSVMVYGARDRFKINPKKTFKGHLVSGYACGLTFSPDGRFLSSGDSMGRLFFWDWRTSRMFRTLQAHQGVCIDVAWHPTRPSLVATCGWDGDIKFWD